ncbi:patatin, partial [Candidatus Fermentibacteria bacterium]|nr:patatin [Candidatus Fermentibacteria bacterium]
IVAGTSMGAVMGALLASGRFDDAWPVVLASRISRIFDYVDSAFPLKSLVDGRMLYRLIRSWFGTADIEDMEIRFAAVATDLATGDEVVMTRGGLASAIRASISIPLVFPPFRREGRWLVDGGLVDPVPTSVARALGADVVVSVDLNSYIPDPGAGPGTLPHGRLHALPGRDQEGGRPNRGSEAGPSFPSILLNSLLILHRSVASARNASHPPDLLIAPDLSAFTGAEFHRAAELARLGYEAAKPAMRELQARLGRA